MTFIKPTDYNRVIKEDIWTKIVSGDDSTVAEIAQDVVDLATGHIDKRYDPATTFARTEADRDGTLLNAILEITVYRVTKRLNPSMMTETMAEAKDDAIKTLEKIQQGKLSLPKADHYVDTTTGEAKSSRAFRSGKRRRNKYRLNDESALL